jgi:transposase
VVAETVPWARGKHQLCEAYMLYLADWAKKISWKEVAQRFRTSWEKVFHSVEYVVNLGLEHRDMNGITAIGEDEVQWHKGHKYLTLVYQIYSANTRLLWIGKERTETTFQTFFDQLGEEAVKRIEYVCSGMWKPYQKVIKQRAGHALHILDRFHIVARMNKALDEVRASEHRAMKQDGYEPVLTNQDGCYSNVRKPDRKAGHQIAGIVAIQLKEYSGLPTEGIISTPMGLCFPHVGREIYCPVDNKSNAVKNRTDEA